MKSFFRQILRYFYIGKKDPNAPGGTYVKLMHGMNRISILVFAAALLLMIYRLLHRHH